MMRQALIVSLLALALVGCEKKEIPVQPAPEASVAVPAPAPPPPVAVAEPSLDITTIPVEEQFEANAEQEITAANLAAKVDELEKELTPL